MEAVVVRQFLNFFQDFINLCQMYNWPNDKTIPEEIRNAFLISQHIEKCLDKFQKKSLIDEFLSLINSNQNTSSLFLKNCFSHPSKYILKKILNSSADISIVNIGFTIFLDLFPEETLEVYLSDIMLEAASTETLLKNLETEMSKDILLDFKSKYLLSEFKDEDHSKKVVIDMLSNCTEDVMNILVQSLLCKDLKYSKSIDIVTQAFKAYMLIKNVSKQKFWKLLFNIQENNFLQLCLNHGEIFHLICKTLVDSGKLIREEMSMDYFYVKLSHSELVAIAKVITKNDNLKCEFLDLVLQNDDDSAFWNNLMT